MHINARLRKDLNDSVLVVFVTDIGIPISMVFVDDCRQKLRKCGVDCYVLN